jgi:hypothetical protein
MRLKILIENDDGEAEPFILKVDRSIMALSAAQRLAAAKAFVCAAFRLCPPPIADDNLGPLRVELATFMNAGVTALLRTPEDQRRSSWWQSIEPDPIAAHGPLN